MAPDVSRFIYPDILVRTRQIHSSMKEQTGFEMRICQGFRSVFVQNLIYAQGRTTPGPKVSNAPGLSSLHNFGLAVDSCFAGIDPWMDHNKKGPFLWNEYGRFSKAFGMKWGGDFRKCPDRPHIELCYGLTLAEIRTLYLQQGLIGLWARLDQLRNVEIGEGWKHLKDELALL